MFDGAHDAFNNNPFSKMSIVRNIEHWKML